MRGRGKRRGGREGGKKGVYEEMGGGVSCHLDPSWMEDGAFEQNNVFEVVMVHIIAMLMVGAVNVVPMHPNKS